MNMQPSNSKIDYTYFVYTLEISDKIEKNYLYT